MSLDYKKRGAYYCDPDYYCNPELVKKNGQNWANKEAIRRSTCSFGGRDRDDDHYELLLNWNRVNNKNKEFFK